MSLLSAPAPRLFSLLAVLFSISLMSSANADYGGIRKCSDAKSSPIMLPMGGEQGVKGQGRLCLESHELKGRLKLKGLTPRNAYTVWWVYIDDPQGCSGGLFDCLHLFEAANPQAVFGRMDSGIAPRRGVLHFNNVLKDMEVSAGSQVWFLVFGHGQADYADGRRLARQLLTPEDPNTGAPHLGVTTALPSERGYPVSEAIFVVE